MKARFFAGILMGGLVSVVVVGCGGGSKPEAKASAPAPATQATQATTASASGGEIGIPECDNYMTKYRACIESKVPDAAKAAMRQGFDQATSAWKQAAATPAAREGLAQACKQATDVAKTAMQSYGCTF
jgi:hypothetical protein